MFLNSAAIQAVDQLYVTTGNQGIITFETAGNDGPAIFATNNSFANTQLNGPKDLAIASLGFLLVANSGNGRIGRIDSTGGFLYALPTNLPALEGLALDSAGNVYVSDYVLNTICKFDQFGSLLRSKLDHVDSINPKHPRVSERYLSHSMIADGQISATYRANQTNRSIEGFMSWDDRYQEIGSADVQRWSLSKL